MLVFRVRSGMFGGSSPEQTWSSDLSVLGPVGSGEVESADRRPHEE